MQNRRTSDRSLAYLLLRATLGLNFFMHGVVRLVAGPGKFADGLVGQFASTPLPAWSVHLFALGLPWAEALVGMCLLLGVLTRAALIVGTLEIAALLFGTTLRQDWATAAIQLMYAFVYAVLVAACEYNVYSVDSLLARRSAESR